jgi:hypothetical protein
LRTEEESCNGKERCSALEHKEATRGSILVLRHKDLFFVLVGRVDNQECKLQVRGFRLLSDRFSVQTFSFPDLHRNHLRETMLGRIPYLKDLVSTTGRMDTLLTCVNRGTQTRL